MKTQSLSPQERERMLIDGLQRLLTGEFTEGKLLSQLRRTVLGMSQQDYAALIGISRRTLSDIENDTGSQSISAINAAFKPFGLRLGLLPTQLAVLSDAVNGLPDLNQQTPKQTGFFRTKT